MISLRTLRCLAGTIAALCCESHADHIPALVQSLDVDGDRVLDVAVAWQDKLWIGYGSGPGRFTWTQVPIEDQGWYRTDNLHTVDFNKDGREEIVLVTTAEKRLLVIFSDTATRGNFQYRNYSPGGRPVGSDVLPDEDGTSGPILSLLAFGSSPQLETLAYTSDRPSRDPLVLAFTSEPVPAGRATGDGTLGFVVLPESPGAASLAWLHQPLLVNSPEQSPKLTWFERRAGLPGLHKATDVTLKRGVIGLIPSWIPGDLQHVPVAVGHGPELGAIYLLRPEPESARVKAQEIPLEYTSIRWQPRSGNYFDGRFIVARDLARDQSIYRWTTNATLELEDQIEPPEKSDAFAGLGAWTETGFATLLLPAAEGQPPEIAFYTSREGRLVFESRSQLPLVDQPRTVPAVLVFDRDPFIDPGARELGGMAAGDWTRSAELRNGIVTARSATYRDSRSGLSDGVTQEFSAPLPFPEGSYALPNQWEPASSLHFLGTRISHPKLDPRDVSSGTLAADSDRDGLDDAWERRFFGGLDFDGAGDPDGDGFANAQEQAGLGDPLDPASHPIGEGDEDMLVTVEWVASPTGLVLRWEAGPADVTYRVETSEDLVQWKTSDQLPEQQGAYSVWSDSQPGDGPRFFRVMISR